MKVLLHVKVFLIFSQLDYIHVTLYTCMMAPIHLFSDKF